ncbi:hypothetical protein ADUPG1_007142 [Aduncisulcus paluster]|uniref:Uncharacterized protein n=1 Tax=Aduncisulcus paluster TaxID=2918883 RepID=A0ABQ5KMK5_9EUKA|nr:hypothetical protein ADUPG1_007142 [Aduncisulcus paluster]
MISDSPKIASTDFFPSNLIVATSFINYVYWIGAVFSFLAKQAVGVVLGVICSILAVLCGLFMACGCCMHSATKKLEDAVMDMDNAVVTP